MSNVTGPDYGKTEAPKEWKLRLFVTNWTPRCVMAYRNLRKICEEHIEDKCKIEVVDILEHPEIARREQIVAVPTLKKLSPYPRRVIYGDFTRTDTVLKGLDVERWERG